MLAAPDAAICTVPVYVPALRPAGETDTVRVDGAVPEASDTLSQVALAVEVQESVPVPPLAIWMDCDAGSAPPAA